MDFNTKYTPQTWPKHPEQATQEGKNKVVGFWIFLACEVVLFASLFATYLALKNKGPPYGILNTKLIRASTSIHDDNVTINVIFNVSLCNVPYEEL